MDSDDPLLSRAAAAIAESKRLCDQQRSVLEEMTVIYEQRMITTMKAVSGLQRSEKQLMERYFRLTGARE